MIKDPRALHKSNLFSINHAGWNRNCVGLQKPSTAGYSASARFEVTGFGLPRIFNLVAGDDKFSLDCFNIYILSSF